ncbi:MAG: TRAM domain-containing protein [Nitrososphaeraceae archaeon]
MAATMNTANDSLKKYDNNKCDKCNIKIHPNFIGYHKCGYANCAICKNAITNSEYWSHIRSHPGHENDSPPPPLQRTFGNRERYRRNTSSNDKGSSNSRSFNRGSVDVTRPKVGKEYEVDITGISKYGDGIASIQGFLIFVKGGKVGEQVKVIVTEARSRFAIAKTS